MAATAEERLASVAEKWVEDAIYIKPSNVPEIVYHYTDAAGLYGMMKSKCLWLTNYRFLNDTSEFAYTKELVRSLIGAANVKHPDAVVTSLQARIVHYQSMNAPSAGYVFSLSEHSDDLSQWRGYANEGKGFTVGLCGESLNSAAASQKDFGFAQVEYDPDRQRKPLKQALQELERVLREEIAKEGHREKQLIEEAARLFDYVAENRSSLNKHASFQAEREWRVFAYPAGDEEVKVRLSKDRLIPYLEISLADAPRLPIKTVGIGPGFPRAEIREAVKALANQFNHKIDIYSANTPYRRV